MACGLIFTMLMMAFTDFFSLYFLFVPQSNLKLSTCSSQATARICLWTTPSHTALSISVLPTFIPWKNIHILFLPKQQLHTSENYVLSRSFGLFLDHPSHDIIAQCNTLFLLETLIPLGQATKGRHFVLFSHATRDHKDFSPWNLQEFWPSLLM